MQKCLQSKQIHSFVEIQPRAVDVSSYQVVSLTLWAELFHHLSSRPGCLEWPTMHAGKELLMLLIYQYWQSTCKSRPRAHPYPCAHLPSLHLQELLPEGTAKVWSQDKVLGCSVKKWSMPLIQIPMNPPALDFPKSSPNSRLCNVYSELRSAGCLITEQDLINSYTEICSCSGAQLCSPPGSSVHGIFQARIMEWVAISFFNFPNLRIEPEDEMAGWHHLLNGHGFG